MGRWKNSYLEKDGDKTRAVSVRQYPGIRIKTSITIENRTRPVKTAKIAAKLSDRVCLKDDELVDPEGPVPACACYHCRREKRRESHSERRIRLVKRT